MTQLPQKPFAPGMDSTGSQELQPVQAPLPTAQKPKVHPFLTRGSIILMGMCLAGFVALFLLGRKAGPNTALGGQNLVYAKVDAALDQMDGQLTAEELSSRTNANAIADDFYLAAQQRQVDREQLQRNPFVFREKAPEPPPIEVPRETEPKDEGVPAELKAAMDAVKSLRLQSVLVGRTPAALISNNLVTQGQVVKGWTVTRIGSREVELTWKDQKYVLELPK